MSETIDLRLVLATLRDVQAEQRTLRTENRLIRDELGELKGTMLTREMAERFVRIFLNHVRDFEARTETSFDRINARLDDIARKLDSGGTQPT
jgi:hypothetical protein